MKLDTSMISAKVAAAIQDAIPSGIVEKLEKIHNRSAQILGREKDLPEYGAAVSPIFGDDRIVQVRVIRFFYGSQPSGWKGETILNIGTVKVRYLPVPPWVRVCAEDPFAGPTGTWVLEDEYEEETKKFVSSL